MDECGTNIALMPLYARAPRGQRAFGSVPRNRRATTLLAGLSLDGIQAPMILEGAVDTLAFETYGEQVLAPSLSPGQVVVLENLSVHTGPRIRQMIEARGGQVLFLLICLPDFTLSEEAFSKLKAWLRRLGARTREALLEALAQALARITAGWWSNLRWSAPTGGRWPIACSGTSTRQRMPCRSPGSI